MIETVGEAVLASVGGLSMVRFTVKRIYWINEQRRLYIKLQQTRRGYNIQHSQPKPPPTYTIPDDERYYP